MHRLAVSLAILSLLAGIGASLAAAHEIPADVTVRMFVHPDGERLTLLVRAPLEAMRDFDFPVRDPGYLDLDAARPLVRDAARVWIAGALTIFEDGRRLPAPRLATARLSLPSDPSFRSYREALEHVRGEPLGSAVGLVPEQALLDVELEAPVRSARSRFALESDLVRLGVRTTTVIRFLPADGTERAFQFTGDPGRVRLDPRWHQAAGRFVTMGFKHILGGLDHLLFLLCLVIPFRRLRPLVALVTAFTVAHSITLVAAALGMAPDALWFPSLVETLIAASILYMALENIVGADQRRRWLITFAFGLVHGFGFSFALGETLQFAGSHLVTSLLAFNLGVEAGQILVVAVAVPLVHLLFRHVVAERMGTILLSAIVAHSAWHWMTTRGAELLAHDVTVPALDARLLASLMRWTMLALVAGGALWALAELLARLDPSGSPVGDPEDGPDRRPTVGAGAGPPGHASGR